MMNLNKIIFVLGIGFVSVSNLNAFSTNETNQIKVTNDMKKKFESVLERNNQLIEMINNYIIKEIPLVKIGNRYVIDYKEITLSKIQSYYGLDKSFFTNYSGSTCSADANGTCFNTSTTGIRFNLDEKGIHITNSIGKLLHSAVNDGSMSDDAFEASMLFGNKTSSTEAKMFYSAMNKYINFLPDKTFQINGAIFQKYNNNVSNLIRKIMEFSNFENYVISKNMVTAYKYDLWIKPDSNGKFLYYKSTLKSNGEREWREFENLNTKTFTIDKPSDLKYVKGVTGDEISVRIDTNNKVGTINYINTGKNNDGTYKWSSYTQKDIRIDNRLLVFNQCDDFKKVQYLDDFSATNMIIKPISNDGVNSVVEVDTISNYFRENYKIQEYGNREIKNFDYSNPSSYANMSGIGYVNGIAPKHNDFKVSMMNRITKAPVTISKVEILKYELFNNKTNSWLDFKPRLTQSVYIVPSTAMLIDLKFNTTGVTELDNIGLYSYGIIEQKNKIYNTFNHLNLLDSTSSFKLDFLYNGYNNIAKEPMINSVPNLPAKIKYRVTFASPSINDNKKMIMLNNEYGCYIKEVQFNKQVYK